MSKLDLGFWYFVFILEIVQKFMGSEKQLVVRIYSGKGPSTKDVREMGRGGVVLKFRTFPDGGEGGWFVKVRTSENF